MLYIGQCHSFYPSIPPFDLLPLASAVPSTVSDPTYYCFFSFLLFFGIRTIQ